MAKATSKKEAWLMRGLVNRHAAWQEMYGDKESSPPPRKWWKRQRSKLHRRHAKRHIREVTNGSQGDFSTGRNASQRSEAARDL